MKKQKIKLNDKLLCISDSGNDSWGKIFNKGNPYKVCKISISDDDSYGYDHYIYDIEGNNNHIINFGDEYELKTTFILPNKIRKIKLEKLSNKK